ncbi:sirt2 [Scenedesmus sp. PABB004]|nr:sirt2 [Scenedesmus sp. PABB004]
MQSSLRGPCRSGARPVGRSASAAPARPPGLALPWLARRRGQPLATPPAAATDGAPASLVLAGHDLTRTIFDAVDARGAAKQAGGAGGRTTFEGLLAADQAWSALRTMKTGADAGPPPSFVTSAPRQSVARASAAGAGAGAGPCSYDAVVAGGTLGVFVAAALAARGWRVAVVERGPLAGRAQEWNISRKELQELVELDLLTPAEAESAIAIEFNPVRAGFAGGKDVWTKDILNLGVKPDRLVQLMRAKLEATGGKVYECVQLGGVEVAGDGVTLTLTSQTAPGGGAAPSGGVGARVQFASSLTTRLLLDCCGHASPIVRQLRWGVKPDGVCLVVGGCARGFDPEANTTADIIYTCGDARPVGAAAAAGGGGPGGASQAAQAAQAQYFWEAFPAADGLLPGGGAGTRAGEWRSDARTTYMFSYMDAQPSRPSLAQLFADYWAAMPEYQGRPGGLEGLEFQRLLFGCFPTYKDSPLRPGFDRVLQIGDASGIQSPLSFGGFGALTRHLRRLTDALHDALDSDALSQSELALVNAYNPGLSSAWMLQRAMMGSTSPDGAQPPPGLINKMLAGNFAAMAGMGDEVLKPFLQDVIQFGPLMRTMANQVVQDPGFVPQLMAHVGPAALADWLLHVGALGGFTALDAAAGPPLRALAGSGALPPRTRFALRRALDALKYGSGADFKLGSDRRSSSSSSSAKRRAAMSPSLPHEPLSSASVAPRPHSDDAPDAHDPRHGVVHPHAADGGAGAVPAEQRQPAEADEAEEAELEQLVQLLGQRLALGDDGAAQQLLQQVKRPLALPSLDLRGVAEYIKSGKARRIVTMTGAGTSVSAGIPDFRTPGTGLYSQLERFALPEPEAVFSIKFFKKDPKPFHLLAKELFPGNFKPTPTHYFIRLLHDKGLLLRAFTQNIDSLEHEAGLPASAVVAAHGNFDSAHCIRCAAEHSLAHVKAAVFADEICTCTQCGGLVKPDIVFFGEQLPDRFYERMEADLPRCDLLLVMGTSLVVHPFASLIDAVPDDCPRVLINRERVGEGMGGGLGLLSSLLGARGGGGFVFDEEDGAWRDALYLGDCDDAVAELAELLGWGDDLRALIEAGGPPTERQLQQQREQREQQQQRAREQEQQREQQERPPAGAGTGDGSGGPPGGA